MAYVETYQHEGNGLAIQMIQTSIKTKSILKVALIAFFAAFAGANTAVAQTDQKVYRVSIAGFPVGTASYSAAVNGNRYEVQGFMGSTGFFGAFLASRYSGAVIGRSSGDRLTPQIFRGRFEQGRKFAEVDIKYSKGRVRQVIRRPERPAQPYDLDPTSVRGALDPISALYFMLRDLTVDKVCTQNFQVFDGGRTSRISMQRSQGEAGTVVCNGVYTRMGGFPPEQINERQHFPFQLTYAPTDDGFFEVREFRATTFWGVAKAVLRTR